MKQAMKNLMALRSDRRAVTALEYGLIAALIAVVVIGSITTLGTSINTAFSKVASSIGSANK
jgi:pilus assembly protein Flp/PilA